MASRVRMHVGLTKIKYVGGIVFQGFDPEVNG